MGISRAALITGPARIVRGAGVLFTQDDIAINVNREVLDIMTSAHGRVDERDINVLLEASFTPEGRWDSATRALLWPYASTLVGTSIFGTSGDTPTAFHGADGALHTMVASAVTKMPSIFLSAAKTMVGQATITGVLGNNLDWSDPAARYTIAGGATFADATPFTPALIKVQPYTGAWGALTGFTNIETEDGWTIDFDLQLEPRPTDSFGTIDMRFKSLSVTARCVPIRPTSAQILTQLKIQDAGAIRGRSLATASDLVITGADTTTIVTLKNAGLRTAIYRFGANVLREGECAWVASRPFSAGSPQALFTIA